MDIKYQFKINRIDGIEQVPYICVDITSPIAHC